MPPANRPGRAGHSRRSRALPPGRAKRTKRPGSRAPWPRWRLPTCPRLSKGWRVHQRQQGDPGCRDGGREGRYRPRHRARGGKGADGRRRRPVTSREKHRQIGKISGQKLRCLQQMDVCLLEVLASYGQHHGSVLCDAEGGPHPGAPLDGGRPRSSRDRPRCTTVIRAGSTRRARALTVATPAETACRRSTMKRIVNTSSPAANLSFQRLTAGSSSLTDSYGVLTRLEMTTGPALHAATRPTMSAWNSAVWTTSAP